MARCTAQQHCGRTCLTCCGNLEFRLTKLMRAVLQSSVAGWLSLLARHLGHRFPREDRAPIAVASSHDQRARGTTEILGSIAGQVCPEAPLVQSAPPGAAHHYKRQTPFMAQTRRPFFIAVALFTVTCAPVGAQVLTEQSFDAEGIITYRRHVDGRIAGEMRRSFVVSVVGSQWRIRSYDEADAAIDHNECTFDGTNVYRASFLRDSNVPPPETNRAAGSVRGQTSTPSPDKGKTRANVVVWPSEVPLSDPTLISAVWLAFASRNYFDGMTSNRAEPFWFAGEEVKELAFKVECAVQLDDRPPFLPRQVVYINPGGKPIVRNGEIELAAYPKPFDRAFTNALYEATQHGRADGLTYPMRFFIARFAPPKPGTAGAELRIVDTYEGETTTFSSPSKAPDLRLHLPSRAGILDKRFGMTSEIQSIQYYVTNGEVRSLEAMAPLYQREVSRLEAARRERRKVAFRRIVVLAVMVGALIGIPCVYRLGRAGRKITEPKK